MAKSKQYNKTKYIVILSILLVLIIILCGILYFWSLDFTNTEVPSQPKVISSNQQILNDFAKNLENIRNNKLYQEQNEIKYSDYFNYTQHQIYCLEAGYNKDNSVYLNDCYIDNEQITEHYGENKEILKKIIFFDNNKILKENKIQTFYRIVNNLNEIIELKLTEDGKITYYNYTTKENKTIWSDSELAVGFILYLKDCTNVSEMAVLTNKQNVYLSQSDILETSEMNYFKTGVTDKVNDIETIVDKSPNSCGKTDLYLNVKDVLYQLDDTYHLGLRYNNIFPYESYIGLNGDYLYIFANKEIAYYVNIGYDNSTYNYLMNNLNQKIIADNIFVNNQDNTTTFYIISNDKKLYKSTLVDHVSQTTEIISDKVIDYKTKKHNDRYNIELETEHEKLTLENYLIYKKN